MSQKKQQLFIRFNELPEDGKSFIYDENDLIIGKREGVSVYNAIKVDGRYTPALPTPTTKEGAEEFFKYTVYNTSGEYEKMYLVSGKQIDTDERNCPVITDVAIVDELSFDEIFPDRRNPAEASTGNRIDEFVDNAAETAKQVVEEVKTACAEASKDVKDFAEEVRTSRTFNQLSDKAKSSVKKASRFAKASAAFAKAFFEKED